MDRTNACCRPHATFLRGEIRRIKAKLQKPTRAFALGRFYRRGHLDDLSTLGLKHTFGHIGQCILDFLTVASAFLRYAHRAKTASSKSSSELRPFAAAIGYLSCCQLLT